MSVIFLTSLASYMKYETFKINNTLLYDENLIKIMKANSLEPTRCYKMLCFRCDFIESSKA